MLTTAPAGVLRVSERETMSESFVKVRMTCISPILQLDLESVDLSRKIVGSEGKPEKIS